MLILIVMLATSLGVSYTKVDAVKQSSRPDQVFNPQAIHAEQREEPRDFVAESNPNSLLGHEVNCSSNNKIATEIHEDHMDFFDDQTTEDDITNGAQTKDNEEQIAEEVSDSSVRITEFKCQNFSRKPLRVYCKSCVCLRYSQNRTTANCSSIRKPALDIPTGLPKSVTRINIFYGNLTRFDVGQVLMYQSLEHVMIYNNKMLKKVGQFTHFENIHSNIKYLHLSYNTISEIDNNSFVKLAKLEYLYLKKNFLQHIRKNMFNGLARLVNLNLALNNITSIENGSFEDMEHLHTLDLSGNKHLLGPNGKFTMHNYIASKNKLHHLRIQGIFTEQVTSYPNDELRMMQSLRIDGIDNAKLGSKPLSHLTRLFIGGVGSFCGIKYIPEDFFINMPHLMTFVISKCRDLVSIDKNAYLNLKKLSMLSISYMNYDLKMAFNDLEKLQNSSLTHLTLTSLLNSSYVYRWLDDIDAKFLRNIPLTSLDLSDNNIVFLGQCFIELLPKTLRLLKLNRNTLTKMVHVLQSLVILPRLNTLDVSNQDLSNLFFKIKSCNVSREVELQSTAHFLGPYHHNDHRHINNSWGVTQQVNTPSFKKRDTEDHCHGQEMMPQNLRILKARSFLDSRYHVLKCQWPSNISLYAIDLTGSYFTRWGEGWLPESVTNANFKNNYCTYIKKDFFPVNNSLEVLQLSNNLLGPQLTGDINGSIFAYLKHLKCLDVSMNSIYQLPSDIFKGLAELENLIVSNNKIQILNISFSQMPNLKFIDFSKNSINWITSHSRNELDAIATQHTVALDLTYNPLPCTCDGLEILTWLNNTNVYLWDSDFLTCIHESGETERSLADLPRELDAIIRQCTYKALTLFMCVSAMLIICTLLASLLMHRYRWKLRYLWSIALVKLIGAELKTPGNGYRFDAYILYTEETRDFVLRDCVRELEVKRGHRLCIEDRDFMPGTYIVSNIVSGVQNSSKTVPIVTPGFYQGEYSEYGVKMALMEEIFAKRSVLYLCFYKPTDNEDLSRDLLTVMKNNNYIEFPPEEQASSDVQEIFWNRMASVIGKNEESFSNEQESRTNPPRRID